MQLFSPHSPVGNAIVNNANEILKLMCNRGTYVICCGINYPIMYSRFNIKYMVLGLMGIVSYMLYA